MSFLQCIIFEADRFGVLARTLRGITVVPQRCCRYDLPGCTLGRDIRGRDVDAPQHTSAMIALRVIANH